MKMLVGLTGKTGSGKSSAAQFFKENGAFVADCDCIAHEVIQSEAVKSKIKQEFSDSVFDTYGNVDRKKLGAVVFVDEEKLLALNSIMHGAIIDKALSMCENSGKDICIIEHRVCVGIVL